MKSLKAIDGTLANLNLEELLEVEKLLKIKIKTARWNSAEWCTECEHEDASQSTEYLKDNKHPVVKKHHWRCADCGGIFQIG